MNSKNLKPEDIRWFKLANEIYLLRKSISRVLRRANKMYRLRKSINRFLRGVQPPNLIITSSNPSKPN